MKKVISLILVLALVVASGLALATGSTTVDTSGATNPTGTTTVVTNSGNTTAATTTAATTGTTETEEATVVVEISIIDSSANDADAKSALEKTADIFNQISSDKNESNTVSKFFDAIASAGDVISTSSSNESDTTVKEKYNVVNAIETVKVTVTTTGNADASGIYSKNTKVPLKIAGLSVKKNVPTVVAFNVPGLGWVILTATVDDDGILTVEVPGDVLEAMEGQSFTMIVMQDDPDIAE